MFTKEQTKTIARIIKTTMKDTEKPHSIVQADMFVERQKGRIEVVDALVIGLSTVCPRFNCTSFRKECGIR
jgi:hypothetical protein